MKEKPPSPFCPDFCEFVKHGTFECRLYTECWHLKDKEVPPKTIEVNISGRTHRVTIIGENEVHAHIWYLKEGTLPQMLPKNYDVFSTPIERQEPSKKDIYDAQKKAHRENRNKTHK